MLPLSGVVSVISSFLGHAAGRLQLAIPGFPPFTHGALQLSEFKILWRGEAETQARTERTQDGPIQRQGAKLHWYLSAGMRLRGASCTVQSPLLAQKLQDILSHFQGVLSGPILRSLYPV
jgi:hypothetical protein